MKTLVKLCTFWIPIKSWRKVVRRLISLKLAEIKIINPIKNSYPDSVFLWASKGGIGEFIKPLSLMKAFSKKIKKNIVIITTSQRDADLCQLFHSVSCHYVPDMSDIPANTLKRPPEFPKTNTLYSFYQLFCKDILKTVYYDIDYTKKYYSLPLETEPEHVSPPPPDRQPRLPNLMQLKIF